MNKIYHFILFCFATLCLAACSDDDPEVSGIDGKDHFISEFALTVDGITYQAMIVGDKITIEIPYNASLKGATVEPFAREPLLTRIHRPLRIGRMNGNS